MICGVMPRFQRWVHLFAASFTCLFFGGMCVLAGTVVYAGLIDAGASPAGCLLSGSLLATLGMWMIVSLVRSLRTLVREFSYDGHLLRFRTVISAKEQVRQLHEVAEIRKGRSSCAYAIGYCLRFRDGQKVYLDYYLENLALLAEQLRFDLSQVQAASGSSVR